MLKFKMGAASIRFHFLQVRVDVMTLKANCQIVSTLKPRQNADPRISLLFLQVSKRVHWFDRQFPNPWSGTVWQGFRRSLALPERAFLSSLTLTTAAQPARRSLGFSVPEFR